MLGLVKHDHLKYTDLQTVTLNEGVSLQQTVVWLVQWQEYSVLETSSASVYDIVGVGGRGGGSCVSWSDVTGGVSLFSAAGAAPHSLLLRLCVNPSELQHLSDAENRLCAGTSLCIYSKSNNRCVM